MSIVGPWIVLFLFLGEEVGLDGPFVLLPVLRLDNGDLEHSKIYDSANRKYFFSDPCSPMYFKYEKLPLKTVWYFIVPFIIHQPVSVVQTHDLHGIGTGVSQRPLDSELIGGHYQPMCFCVLSA